MTFIIDAGLAPQRLIDEIDSHLHVLLQRLILPFFTESFPKIQFIVTTHSPFVLMSTRDTLIFDLGKEAPYSISQVKSQNEILRDYLGISTAMPVWAEQSLATILDKYLTRNPDDISLADLKDELKKRRSGNLFPEFCGADTGDKPMIALIRSECPNPAALTSRTYKTKS